MLTSSCPSAQGNLRHWIEDPDCRDQYSVIYEAGERTAIFNNDSKDAITVEERAVSQMPSSILMGVFEKNMPLNAAVCPCSAGRRRTCAGLLKAPTWPPSTSGVLHCGVVRSSNRFRGSAIRVSPSSTSHHARGERRPRLCMSAPTHTSCNVRVLT